MKKKCNVVKAPEQWETLNYCPGKGGTVGYGVAFGARGF